MKIKITTKSLIGDLENFPIEVVKKMLEYQYKQNNIIDIKVFIPNCGAEKHFNGFRWADTIEGHDFWYEVIHNKKFDVFFKRYPKSKEVYIYGDAKNGKNVIKELESRGGINKWDYCGNANMLYFIDPITNYISGACKTEETFQNLIKTIYTEISPGDYTTVELTMQEIAEKLGIDVEQLRIKK